jgi:hypothetical protein
MSSLQDLTADLSGNSHLYNAISEDEVTLPQSWPLTQHDYCPWKEAVRRPSQRSMGVTDEKK